jgi:hypothetical protein
MLGHYSFFSVSPWWLKLCPSNWSLSGMGLQKDGLGKSEFQMKVPHTLYKGTHE